MHIFSYLVARGLRVHHLEEHNKHNDDDNHFKTYTRKGDVPHTHPSYTPSYTPTYSETFDSTLGFPGEGPPCKIMTYNINGSKNKIGSVLARAKAARIDIVLLQETHYYNDSYHSKKSGLLNSIKSKDYKPYLSHATTEDISAGVAICILADSRSVTIPEGATLTTIIPGRAISLRCNINEEGVTIANLYAPANPTKRKQFYKTLTENKKLPKNTIVGGDFNCVDDVNLDTQKNTGNQYANNAYREWKSYAAQQGWQDAYRRIHGDKPGGFTRMTAAVHTRIDRIYTAKYNCPWRWAACDSDPCLLAGLSDHLPVIGQIDTAPPRQPSQIESNINRNLLGTAIIKRIIEKIWEDTYTEFPHQGTASPPRG